MKNRARASVFKALPVLFCVVSLFASPAFSKKKSPTLLDKIASQVDFALVKPPEDFESCFAPEEPCDAKLVKFIDSARKSIDVAIYDVNLDQFVHHLLVQAKKLPVRVLVDRRQAKGPHSAVGLLRKAGVPLRFGRQRGIMHNKFVIVDGKRLETGSFNFTNGAAFSNQENQVYLADPGVLERYRRQYEKMWKEGLPVPPDS